MHRHAQREWTDSVPDLYTHTADHTGLSPREYTGLWIDQRAIGLQYYRHALSAFEHLAQYSVCLSTLAGLWISLFFHSVVSSWAVKVCNHNYCTLTLVAKLALYCMVYTIFTQTNITCQCQMLIMLKKTYMELSIL